MLEELVKDLDSCTLSELKSKYNLPMTKIKKFLKENNLEIKYAGRTPYTNQLIPASDKRVAKYQDKKKREKTNDIIFEDSDKRNWPQREIDSRVKDIEEYDYQIGYLLSQISDLQKQLNKIVKNKINQQFMISICEKLKETKDYCGYVEEEAYGKRPDIKEFDVSMITDKMVLGYLSTKLNPLNLAQLSKLLENDNEMEM